MATRVSIKSPAGDQFLVKPSEAREWQNKGCTIVGVKEVESTNPYRPTRGQLRKRTFAAANNDNAFYGWTTTTGSIDSYLRQHLTVLRARSREQTHNNPLLKRAVGLSAKNVVGAKGIAIHPKVVRSSGQLDKSANSAIKEELKNWADYDCDYAGRLSWVEMQNLWIRTAAIDGEFLARIHPTGEYGIQLQNIDPEILDSSRNQRERNGNITRLGVEYRNAKRIAYWLREADEHGNYHSGRASRVPASEIIHCFLAEWPDQSRGIPWGYVSLRRLKHLDAYDESALVAARAGSSKMGFITGGDDDDDELEGEDPVMDFSPGTIEKLGEDEEFQSFDPTYPTEAYTPFTKKGQRDAGMGMDISYASLTGDMSDVNYSSIRYGGQDERESFIDKQNWLIRCAVRPIYEAFIRNAVLRQKIKIGGQAASRPVTEYYTAFYQGRRWLSTDPQKEAKGHEMDLGNKLTSPQRIIVARGEDPDEIVNEIQEWARLTGEGNAKEAKE